MTRELLIIGSGLLGASIGMGAREAGWGVQLEDVSPSSLALARDVGAGVARKPGDPDPALVVVAAPPDVTADLVCAALQRFKRATVTDVASVKTLISRRVGACAHSTRYVGSHPMAGSERSGAGAANVDLFRSRAWVLCPLPDTAPAAVKLVRDLATDLGAYPVSLPAAAHDAAVAAVSHLPQLVSTMVAARLCDQPDEALALAGQGLRDVTRIAHSDPKLWVQIIAANTGPISALLQQLDADVRQLLTALERAGADPLSPGLAGALTQLFEDGNRGVARIPGKHGGAPRRYRELAVLVPDTPGELGRLFSELGQAGVNIEDLTLEHSPKGPMGVARLQLEARVEDRARTELTRRGWVVLPSGA